MLAVACRLARKKPRGTIATEIGNNDPKACGGQRWRDVHEAVDVIGPAMQQDHRGAVRRTNLRISDVEDPGVDLLQQRKRRVGAWLGRRGVAAPAESGKLSCVAATAATAAPRSWRRG